MLSLLFLLSTLCNAGDINVVNKTGNQMRIISMSSKCGENLVKEPIFINKDKSYTFKNIEAVVHTYTICGSGTCSTSAIGVKRNKNYTLNVILSPYIDGQPIPEDYKTGNFDCSKI